MIIKDLTEFQSSEGKVTFTGKISAILKYGFSWRKERENQENIIRVIEDIIGNECILLRSVKLPNEEKLIPLVLISPSGLTVLNPKNLTGTFQAKDDTWREMDRVGDLVSVEPNPIRETLSYTRAIQKYFEEHNLKDIPFESVLAFNSTAIHVDSRDSAVRVLLSDAIKNFAHQVEAYSPNLSRQEKKRCAQLLIKPRSPSYSPPSPQREYSPQSPAASPKAIQGLNSILKMLKFSKRQWILLGFFLSAEILLLIFFIFLVLSAT